MSNPQIGQGATGEVGMTVPYTSTPCMGETGNWFVQLDFLTIAHSGGGPNGWSVSIEYISPTSGIATVIVPANATVNQPPADYRVEYHNLCVDNTLYYFAGNFDVIEGSCTCVVTAEPSASSVSASGYTLTVTLVQEGCEEPLEDIVWSPEPDSGQGTTAAIYNGCQLGTSYSGTVSATDADGCAASAEFQFLKPIGGCDPPCGA